MLEAFALSAYQEHVNSAIAILESEIVSLENAGTRPGSLQQSSTQGGKYTQWHWVHGNKRTYVSIKKRPTYQAEIERWREVESLRATVGKLVDCIGLGIAPVATVQPTSNFSGNFDKPTKEERQAILLAASQMNKSLKEFENRAIKPGTEFKFCKDDVIAAANYGVS
jgi:hypothetical protein